MAQRLKVPETFRCSATMRGEPCPCEMTRVNTFTYSLSNLDRKAEKQGKRTHEILAENALCPWHGRFLAKVQKNIVRLEGVLSLLERRELQRRANERRKKAARERDNRLHSRVLAHQPALGAALMRAGIAR